MTSWFQGIRLGGPTVLRLTMIYVSWRFFQIPSYLFFAAFSLLRHVLFGRHHLVFGKPANQQIRCCNVLRTRLECNSNTQVRDVIKKFGGNNWWRPIAGWEKHQTIKPPLLNLQTLVHFGRLKREGGSRSDLLIKFLPQDKIGLGKGSFSQPSFENWFGFDQNFVQFYNMQIFPQKCRKTTGGCHSISIKQLVGNSSQNNYNRIKTITTGFH